MKNVFLVFSGHFQSDPNQRTPGIQPGIQAGFQGEFQGSVGWDLFPKGSKVILWYVLVISRFLLLWRLFLEWFQEDSATFWVILG